MDFYYKTKIDNYYFTIVEGNNFIVYITLDDLKLDIPCKKTELISKTINELDEYFRGIRTTFDIPIKPQGTKFQIKVWKEMQKISYGKVISYGELAKLVGSPRASRAIGSVCHNNKILILIPCHRVVAKNSLGGFGCGIDIKIKLLELENAII